MQDEAGQSWPKPEARSGARSSQLAEGLNYLVLDGAVLTAEKIAETGSWLGLGLGLA